MLGPKSRCKSAWLWQASGHQIRYDQRDGPGFSDTRLRKVCLLELDFKICDVSAILYASDEDEGKERVDLVCIIAGGRNAGADGARAIKPIQVEYKDPRLYLKFKIRDFIIK